MSLNKSKLVVTLVAATSIFAAITLNNVLSASQQRTPPPKAPAAPPTVSVTHTKAVSESASIVAYGEVTSRNQLALTSQVSGQVVFLSDKFLSGKQFKQGELIARIEAVNYQQAVATAKANLADAKLALAQEQQNSEQAKQEWQQSGLAAEAASDLVLHKPQLEAAEMKFQMALKALEKAQYDLDQTEILAPFDALVVSRSVQLGSNIQTGTTIAQLYDTSLFEVSLPLSDQQWQLLPQSLLNEEANIQVELVDQTGENRWQARIDRSEVHINSATRQRALVVALDQPLQQSVPLFPGSFVKAEIVGQRFSELWQIPASALIDTGRVWQVTEQGMLAYLPVDLKFSNGNYAYVKPKTTMAKAQVVNRPLSSYLENMKVQAKVEG